MKKQQEVGGRVDGVGAGQGNTGRKGEVVGKSRLLGEFQLKEMKEEGLRS